MLQLKGNEIPSLARLRVTAILDQDCGQRFLPIEASMAISFTRFEAIFSSSTKVSRYERWNVWVLGTVLQLLTDFRRQ
jgi:hypothetical protein